MHLYTVVLESKMQQWHYLATDIHETENYVNTLVVFCRPTTVESHSLEPGSLEHPRSLELILRSRSYLLYNVYCSTMDGSNTDNWNTRTEILVPTDQL